MNKRMGMPKTKKERYAEQAIATHKAWIAACAWLAAKPSEKDSAIPDYANMDKTIVERSLKDLTDSFQKVLGEIIYNPSKSIEKAIKWFASKYELTFVEKKKEAFTLCTAGEFEKEVGKLKVSSIVDVPAYAELLFQGWHGVAIRHPEYMLSRDLEFLYSIYIDLEDQLDKINWSSKQSELTGGASENAQTLARNVIQTCFNLLESFTNGIARQYLLTNQNIDKSDEKILENNNYPLSIRIILIPELLFGCVKENYESQYINLFKKIKRHRDSFVHCVPGRQESKYGYIKEDMFNDINRELVISAVYDTIDLICIIWKHVYDSEKPKWLPKIDDSKQLYQNNLRLFIP